MGIVIAAHCAPSSELGGDFWCARRLDASRLAVLIADVSGHGVTAALNSFRVHALIPTSLEVATDPARLLGELSRGLRRLMPSGNFATAFYGVIDVASDSLTYAAAASPNPILISTKDGELCPIDGRGLPLGVSESAVYRNVTVRFHRKAHLFLYSDAMSETPDTEGALLEEPELGRLVRAGAARGGPREVLDSVLAHFKATRSAALKDDLTAISIGRSR